VLDALSPLGFMSKRYPHRALEYAGQQDSPTLTSLGAVLVLGRPIKIEHIVWLIYGDPVVWAGSWWLPLTKVASCPAEVQERTLGND
jgi:hypothetical protein